MKSDSITAYGDKDIQVNKIYAEGNFGDSMLKVGRYGEFSSYGRIIDTEISGAEYTFEAGDLSGALTYGRLKDSRTLAGTKIRKINQVENMEHILEQSILLLD